MRSPFSDVRAEKKKRKTFVHSDINNIIFHNIPPLYTFYPFQQLKAFSKKRIPLTIKTTLLDSPKNEPDAVMHALFKIGEIEVANGYQIPEWFIQFISPEYYIVNGEWLEYLSKEITNFCESNFNSRLQWSSFKRGENLFKEGLSFEIKLWIYTNDLLDQQKDRKFIFDVKESLLPWLNPKLFTEVRKKEENTRVNVDYEKQRKELFESTKINQEELDEIV